MINAALKQNSKHIGDSGEQSFLDSVTRLGIYVQQMPATVGFDFTIGVCGTDWPVELKCTLDSALRIKHFTPIELRVAEARHEKGLPYYVAYPLLNGFGVTTWAKIRSKLLNRETVALDQALAVMWLPSKEWKGGQGDGNE